MQFRIVKTECKSKYHDRFVRFFKNPEKLKYYVVQYKKSPSFFGLIKHEWISVRYNAEELAHSIYTYDDRIIRINPNSILYDERDIFVPGIEFAKQLLVQARERFGHDPMPIELEHEIVYAEKDGMVERPDPAKLAKEYDGIIGER